MTYSGAGWRIILNWGTPSLISLAALTDMAWKSWCEWMTWWTERPWHRILCLDGLAGWKASSGEHQSLTPDKKGKVEIEHDIWPFRDSSGKNKQSCSRRGSQFNDWFLARVQAPRIMALVVPVTSTLFSVSCVYRG